ncbi:MAG: isochorismate synthase [Bacteriovoracaceae bacterium]|nr:isochorismate synthase [Bacteriovoracaceae bacterium]
MINNFSPQKAQLLAVIKKLFSGSLDTYLKKANENAQFQSISISTPLNDITESIGLVEVSPLFYFKDLDNIQEFLALGSVAIDGGVGANQVDACELMAENKHLRFFGGQRFNQETPDSEWEKFGKHFFFLPLLEFSNNLTDFNKVVLTVNFCSSIINDESKRIKLVERIEQVLTTPPSFQSSLTLKKCYTSIARKQWNDVIDRCLDEIENQNIEKVVIARKEILKAQHAFNPKDLLRRVQQSCHSSYLVYLQIDDDTAFLSLSPERLFLIEEGKIFVDSLAGTVRRGNTKIEDDELAQLLQSSAKDLNEHRIVSCEVEEKLAKLCDCVEVVVQEDIRKLPFIQHLHTSFFGVLNKDVSVAATIKTLHPTPAVGGRPWSEAFDLQLDSENFDRGLYAGPIGYMSANTCEFVVGIRSTLINGRDIHIYGGAGIVTGSQGSKEWIEIDNKMQNFLQIL